MKRIAVIAVLLAVLLSLLTSCEGSREEKGTISRSSVGEYWDALLGGEHKVEKIDVSLRLDTSDFNVASRDGKTVDKLIAFLKEVDLQIEKEINDPFGGYTDIYNYNQGSIFLYMDTGEEDATVKTVEDENGTYEIKYNYIIHIEFTYSEYHIYVLDSYSKVKTSAFFKCEKATSEHCKAIKEIFE